VLLRITKIRTWREVKMKYLTVIFISILVVCTGNMNMFSQQNRTAGEKVSFTYVSPRTIIVDDYAGVSLTGRQWYYTRIGTDRGAMGDGSYTANIGGGSASVTVNSGWGGIWTALLHNAATNDSLNPSQLLGPYIKSQYQSNITGVEVDITSGSGNFKIELKDKNNNFIALKTFSLGGGKKTLQFIVSPTKNIAKLNWIVDGAGHAVVDEVRFLVESPNYTVAEAVFLFTFGHLSQCYDANSGLVRDRARWPVQDFAAVQTIGTFALATAIAWDLGYVTESTARTIIQKTKTTILNLPRHAKGLLPHYLKNGNIVENTEWSGIDTAITLIAEILACQALGEDTLQLEALLQAIDWNDLTDNGTHSIGMGYDYNGQKLTSYWDTFGSEALLIATAYSAATGDNTVKLDQYGSSPTWDGSGFNDEMAALFFPITGTDIWGNNWTQYRQEAFNQQIDYFSGHWYAADGLFGLSASEVPEPWAVEEDEIYQAWGVGGHNNKANDGTTTVGYPIIAPHYAAMIGAEYPGYFEDVFLYLLETKTIFTPLNNVESFGIDNADNLRWNSLKGAWNLSLQVLGAGRGLSGRNYLPYQALNENSFLSQGFILIMPPGVTITSPNGGENWQIDSSQTITWTSTGLTGDVTIDLYKGGTKLANIGTAAVDTGSFSWKIPSNLTSGDDFQVRIYQNTIEDYSDNVFSITGGTPPEISLNRSTLSFGAVQSQTTASQVLLINNSGGGTLSWTVSVNQNWLQVTPSSGTAEGIVTVSIEASGLSAGSYLGTVSVEDPNAANSPRHVTVSLQVYASGSSSVPFGSFDTPLHGSTVRSSIPVTGWALDDIGVTDVKIYRAQGNTQVYIGDAVLVEGARPDVEKAFPGYPFNYKAGWGYMMLTNFLPNKGNGTYTIYAKARDKEGNEVTMGSKTITCDNANAVKPFGAIDTPNQGGTASGGSFINWGWVLTPLPNSIPTDGSTISVYVDGVNIGHPTYNIYRSDIADLFPGYNNSNGAAGYFYLDTTGYSNGVHTIQWVAIDSAGNTDGIGSRYFTIRNSSNSQQKSGNRLEVKPGNSIVTVNYLAPILVKKGYNENREPQKIYPGKNGMIDVEIKELERVEICFFGSTQSISQLPIGSTLDRERGVFYWQPGVGFLGEYRLVFVTRDFRGKIGRREIRVKISPG
jgi:hypothetical protein